jgi:hypothetical protein
MHDMPTAPQRQAQPDPLVRHPRLHRSTAQEVCRSSEAASKARTVVLRCVRPPGEPSNWQDSSAPACEDAPPVCAQRQRHTQQHHGTRSMAAKPAPTPAVPAAPTPAAAPAACTPAPAASAPAAPATRPPATDTQRCHGGQPTVTAPPKGGPAPGALSTGPRASSSAAQELRLHLTPTPGPAATRAGCTTSLTSWWQHSLVSSLTREQPSTVANH